MEQTDRELRDKRRLQIFNEFLEDLSIAIKENRENRKGNLTDEQKLELIQMLEENGFFTINVIEKVIYKEKPLKSTPEELEYQKEYRRMKKILDDREAIEKVRQNKLDKARATKRLFCRFCSVMVEPLEIKVEAKRKVNRTKESISIKGTCPTCGREAIGYGGHL